MALGNWFEVVWDINTHEQLIDGILETKNYKIETHKNWLYITPKGSDSSLEFDKGEITGEFYITAKKVDQTMFGEVYTYNENDEKEGFYFILGYGYDGDKWVGCRPSEFDLFDMWLEMEHPKVNSNFIQKTKEGVNQGEVYICKKLAEMVNKKIAKEETEKNES